VKQGVKAMATRLRAEALQRPGTRSMEQSWQAGTRQARTI